MQNETQYQERYHIWCCITQPVMSGEHASLNQIKIVEITF